VVILVTTTKGKWKAAKLQNDIMQWLVNTTAKPSKKSTYKAKKRVTPRVIHKAKPKVKPKAKSKAKSKTRVYSEPSSMNQERFYVQAGSFVTQPKKAFLLGIERLGLGYKVKYAQKYKVLIGPYSKESDARNALKKVRAKVSKGAFIVKQ
jgi:cell division protein FtsN